MTSSPPDSSTPTSRWAVILVRGPEDSAILHAVLPRSRPVSPEDLPLVTRITDDIQTAHATADRLRDVGCMVVIVEEPIDRQGSAFCEDHPAQFAALTCRNCDNAICPGCIAAANGTPLCTPCRIKFNRRNRSNRRRQLMLILVFVAFLYKVWDHLKQDAEQVHGTAPITIGIMQFSPKADMGANIIRQLNQATPDTPSGGSLKDLAGWLNTEYSRYTGNKERKFRVETRGPFAVDISPPALRKPGDTWFKAMFRAWKYPRYFRQLALDHGIAADKFTVKVYVAYGGRSPDMASHSRGSSKGRVAMTFVSIDELNPGYPLVTIAHEIGHALGAYDTYDAQTSRAIHPEGYVEPFKRPLFPQRYAELMAVDIPISRLQEQEISTLKQLRVGHNTAAQMGWIPPEQATLFYAPSEITPEEKLETQDFNQGDMDTGKEAEEQ